MLKDPEQLKLLKKQKRKKYGNRSIVVNSHRFDSVAEAARYILLLNEKRTPWVTIFWPKPTPFVFKCGTKYYPDFYVSLWRYDLGDAYKSDEWYEDVKGGKATQTAVWKLKMKLLKTEYPWAKLKVVSIDPKSANALVQGYLGGIGAVYDPPILELQ